MVLSRTSQKFDRMTITLVPTADERSFRQVPSTFNAANRTYAWRHSAEMDYMIVPRRVSSREIKVDIFVDSPKKRKTPAASLQRTVSEFVKEKIQSDWKGLKLGGIARASAAMPPDKLFTRGTIEEMLGTQLE